MRQHLSGVFKWDGLQVCFQRAGKIPDSSLALLRELPGTQSGCVGAGSRGPSNLSLPEAPVPTV